MGLTDRFIRSAPLPLAVMSAEDHRVLAASPAFTSAVGSPEETEDSLLPDLFTDSAAVRRHIESVESGRLAASATQATNRAGDAVLLTIWRLPAAAATAGDAGAELGVLAAAGTTLREIEPDSTLAETLREVNEALLLTALREQAHATEARAESEAKSVFLASVSHELRTPLNSILGYADLLSAGVPEELPPALHGHVGRIQDASRHLLSLIEQIIEASRAEFDDEVRSERFDLRKLLAELAELIRPQAADKEVRLVTELPDQPLPADADRRKLRQVVLNLLANAIKFTDPGGLVRLRLEAGESGPVIQVIDTGVGIDPADQDSIFNRFWQADQTTVRTSGGMGIGLWVVRTLVVAMGGTVTVDSTPGEGATFQVALPR